MFTKQTDGKFEKWVESGLSTFEIRRLVAEIYFSNALKHKGVALKIITMCDEGVVGRVNILNAEDYKPKLYKWNILVLQIN